MSWAFVAERLGLVCVFTTDAKILSRTLYMYVYMNMHTYIHIRTCTYCTRIHMSMSMYTGSTVIVNRLPGNMAHGHCSVQLAYPNHNILLASFASPLEICQRGPTWTKTAGLLQRLPPYLAQFCPGASCIGSASEKGYVSHALRYIGMVSTRAEWTSTRERTYHACKLPEVAS